MRPASWIGPMSLAALALALACEHAERPDFEPEGPTPALGGTSPGAPGVDAAADALEPALVVRGRVCRVFDLRDPTTCPTVDGDVFVIAELDTGRTTVSDIDGRFALPLGSVFDSTIAISGTGTRTTLLRVTPGQAGIIAPVVDVTTFQGLLGALNLTEPINTGAVLLQLRENESPARRARVIAPGVSTLFDTPLPPGWNDLGPTGDFGAALIVGSPATTGLTGFQGVNSTITVTRTVDLPVRAGTLTFGTIDLTP